MPAKTTVPPHEQAGYIWVATMHPDQRCPDHPDATVDIGCNIDTGGGAITRKGRIVVAGAWARCSACNCPLKFTVRFKPMMPAGGE